MPSPLISPSFLVAPPVLLPVDVAGDETAAARTAEVVADSPLLQSVAASRARVFGLKALALVDATRARRARGLRRDRAARSRELCHHVGSTLETGGRNQVTRRADWRGADRRGRGHRARRSFFRWVSTSDPRPETIKDASRARICEVRPPRPPAVASPVPPGPSAVPSDGCGIGEVGLG